LPDLESCKNCIFETPQLKVVTILELQNVRNLKKFKFKFKKQLQNTKLQGENKFSCGCSSLYLKEPTMVQKVDVELRVWTKLGVGGVSTVGRDSF
jgi:hypothetical protein